jgi:ATP-dependent Clp protease ATP-binding subunit ClpA
MTMLDRFTTAARKAVKAAGDTARAAGAPAVGEEHLLGGVLDQPDCTAVALLARCGVGPDQHADVLAECRDYRRRGGIGRAEAEALRGLGIEVDEIIDRVEQIWGEGALVEPVPAEAAGRGRWKRGPARGPQRPATGGRVPWRPESRRVLETALRQALDLGSRTVGSEHLLLGLLLREGVAREVLTARGVTALHIRTLVQADGRESTA